MKLEQMSFMKAVSLGLKAYNPEAVDNRAYKNFACFELLANDSRFQGLEVAVNRTSNGVNAGVIAESVVKQLLKIDTEFSTSNKTDGMYKNKPIEIKFISDYSRPSLGVIDSKESVFILTFYHGNFGLYKIRPDELRLTNSDYQEYLNGKKPLRNCHIAREQDYKRHKNYLPKDLQKKLKDLYATL